MNLRKITVVLAALVALATPNLAEAKHRHGGGSCDGIHRCRCGSTQTSHFNLPRVYNGHNLWQAVEWTHAFPRTDAHAGAVGYVRHGGPTGHVFRVVSVTGPNTALVADDRGTYERNLSGAIFADPSGNRAVPVTTTYHAKSRKGRHMQVAQFEPQDRLAVH